MRCFPFILIAILASSACSSPAPSMYQDRIARDVGDILTIEIVDNTTASATAKTNTKAEYAAELSAGGTGALDFIPLLGGSGSTKSEHKGDGRTIRQGSLRGTITVKIVEVYPNGNLRIEGQKEVIINGERQLTILSGVIRSEDITPRNTITSDLLADASISYKGKGILANAERPGIIARIFDWLF
jgi:flagellar L-ring protein precursor FlgH